MVIRKADIILELQSKILRLQGFKATNHSSLDARFGPLTEAFPNGSFPIGAVHEFLQPRAESAAATVGFISGLLATLMGTTGTTLWISASRKLFPPALKNFGIEPDRFVFIDLSKERDVTWAMDEALKCAALTAVVAEVQELSFTASRRLQLAVEQSQVTGFILRKQFSSQTRQNTTACLSRWKITSLQSYLPEDLPGVGFPSWKVELLRMRNGKTGVWDVGWFDGRLFSLKETPASAIPIRTQDEKQKKVG